MEPCGLYSRVCVCVCVCVCVSVSHQSRVQRQTLDVGAGRGDSSHFPGPISRPRKSSALLHRCCCCCSPRPGGAAHGNVSFPRRQAPVSAGGSRKEPADAQKDDGVFKAPPPPPKVTKFVTLPTDLYQDTITALKCRKEHKEVSGSPPPPPGSLLTRLLSWPRPSLGPAPCSCTPWCST